MKENFEKAAGCMSVHGLSERVLHRYTNAKSPSAIDRRRQLLAAVRPGSIEPFVTASEVASYLSLNPRTVAKMARDGRLPAHRICGSERKTWRFLISEVAAFIASEIQK